MAQAQLSMTTTDLTEIKQGTLTIDEPSQYAWMLPCRANLAVQGYRATLRWQMPDGRKASYLADANEIVLEYRGGGGIPVAFTDFETSASTSIMGVLVVGFESTVEKERPAGRGSKATGQKGAVCSGRKLLDYASEITLSKVNGIRLATDEELDSLQNGFYMTEEGKNYWDASAMDKKPTGSDEGEDEGEEEEEDAVTNARMAVEADLYEHMEAWVEMPYDDRAAELAKDYRRYTSRVIVDTHRKGDRSEKASQARSCLSAGYAALGEIMANFFVRGVNVVDYEKGTAKAIEAVGEQSVAWLEKAKGAIAAAMPEIENDIIPSLLIALRLKGSAAKYAPTDPPAKKGDKKGGARERKPKKVSTPRTVKTPSEEVLKLKEDQNKLKEAQSAAIDKLTTEHAAALQTEQQEVSEEKKRRLDVERRYELDMNRFAQTYSEMRRELDHAKGSLEDGKLLNAAKRLRIPDSPFDLQRRPFNQGAASVTRGSLDRPTGFVFATAAPTRPRGL